MRNLKRIRFFIMFGKRFEREYEMITNALKTEKGDLLLRKYLTPFVQFTIDEFTKEFNITDLDKESLFTVAWKHFSLAVRSYKRRADLMVESKNDLYYFKTYFRWFIRQTLLEHLNDISK